MPAEDEGKAEPAPGPGDSAKAAQVRGSIIPSQHPWSDAPQVPQPGAESYLVPLGSALSGAHESGVPGFSLSLPPNPEFRGRGTPFSPRGWIWVCLGGLPPSLAPSEWCLSAGATPRLAGGARWKSPAAGAGDSFGPGSGPSPGGRSSPAARRCDQPRAQGAGHSSLAAWECSQQCSQATRCGRDELGWAAGAWWDAEQPWKVQPGKGRGRRRLGHGGSQGALRGSQCSVLKSALFSPLPRSVSSAPGAVSWPSQSCWVWPAGTCGSKAARSWPWGWWAGGHWFRAGGSSPRCLAASSAGKKVGGAAARHPMTLTCL